MKLIVGLGNPGNIYNNTRHNLGYFFIDYFAEKIGEKIEKNKFEGKYAEVEINKEKVILLKPEKFMNLSGEVIKSYISYFKIPIENILVICDDMNLEVGAIKLKSQGSCGGHNGLKNIEENLLTSDYKRLKVGISRDKSIQTTDHVLGKFNNEEQQIMNEKKDLVCNIIYDFCQQSFEKVMSKYNAK